MAKRLKAAERRASILAVAKVLFACRWMRSPGGWA